MMQENTLLISVAIGAGLIAAVFRARLDAVIINEEAQAEPDQEPTMVESIVMAIDPANYGTDTSTDNSSMANTNIEAFLTTIAIAEGTAGPRGYQTMFGYRYFDNYADHPRQYWPYTDLAGRNIKTSAAGRYQIIVKTWDSLKAKLALVDFSPASQDRAAIELIRQRRALEDVKAGRFQLAVAKCAPVWASLPGAGYSQPERSMNTLTAAFQNAGGILA